LAVDSVGWGRREEGKKGRREEGKGIPGWQCIGTGIGNGKGKWAARQEL